MSSDAAQSFKTSGSTATIATREELKLSPNINRHFRRGWDRAQVKKKHMCFSLFVITVYETLGNKSTFRINIFDFFWCNVFPLCQLKYVFLPVMNIASFNKDFSILLSTKEISKQRLFQIY